MNLQTKREFYEIAEDFKNNKFDLTTIAELVNRVWSNHRDLTSIEGKMILEIPYTVLSCDVELIDEENWAKKNSSYFAGNLYSNKDIFKNWHEIFESGNYELKDIAEFCEITKDDFDTYGRNSFSLRNVEVTLSDNVKLKDYSKFNKSGETFWQHMKTILNNQ